MKKERPIQNLLLVSGMIGLLFLALICDVLLDALTVRNAQLGGLDATLIWMYPLIQLVWMLGAIGLVWLMISGGSYSRWVSVIYLCIGLIILYTNPILFVNELPDSLYVVVEYLSPGTMVFQGGGIVAAIGLLSLWFWKEPVKDEILRPEAAEMIDKSEEIIEDEDLSKLPG